jgi:Amt family ammonium transporter
VRTRAPKYLLGAAFGAVASTLLIGANAYADSGEDALAAVNVLGEKTSLLWMVIGAVLVIFMQAGFALVETGFIQKKNAAEVMSTNFAIFGLGFVGFLFVGFPSPSPASARSPTSSACPWP